MPTDSIPRGPRPVRTVPETPAAAVVRLDAAIRRQTRTLDAMQAANRALVSGDSAAARRLAERAVRSLKGAA